MSDDAAPSAPQRTVRPRHAATLLIVRRDGPKPRVLMGRRHATHNFMPDKWVFPGGRIDPSDYRAPFATDLSPEVLAKLNVEAPGGRSRALAMAAIRETFEEAGLLLAKAAPPRTAVGPWREFLAQGALADLEALRFVGRAVTPPFVHKRFDARFFMADAERLTSLERQPDCGELDQIDWLDIDDALGLNLADVTRMMVSEVVARLDNPNLPIPFMRMVRRKRHISHI